jgi:hypothetical protein
LFPLSSLLTTPITSIEQRGKIQWPKEKGKYNGQKKKENTMAKRKRKIQWPKEKGQTIDVQNTTKKTKDRATSTLLAIVFSFFFWPLYFPFSFGHCIFLFLLAIVFSLFSPFDLRLLITPLVSSKFS